MKLLTSDEFSCRAQTYLTQGRLILFHLGNRDNPELHHNVCTQVCVCVCVCMCVYACRANALLSARILKYQYPVYEIHLQICKRTAINTILACCINTTCLLRTYWLCLPDAQTVTASELVQMSSAELGGQQQQERIDKIM